MHAHPLSYECTGFQPVIPKRLVLVAFYLGSLLGTWTCHGLILTVFIYNSFSLWYIQGFQQFCKVADKLNFLKAPGVACSGNYLFCYSLVNNFMRCWVKKDNWSIKVPYMEWEMIAYGLKRKPCILCNITRWYSQPSTQLMLKQKCQLWVMQNSPETRYISICCTS